MTSSGSKLDYTTYLNSICYAMSDRYSIRMKMQKIEFLVCWLLVLANIATMIVTQLQSTIFSFTNFYIQVSVVSRAVAYAFDFAHASVKGKLNSDNDDNNSNNNNIGVLPEWLILHHCGVLVQHVTMGCFIIPHFYCNGIVDRFFRAQLIIFLLCSQASHNTWMKRHSVTLYWFNDFGIGLPCSVVSVALVKPPAFLVIKYFMNEILINETEDVASILTNIYIIGLTMTVAGILKLVMGGDRCGAGKMSK